MPGFVRVTGAGELAFPDYDGNGMFKSLGNMLVNPDVGLLFIAMHEQAAAAARQRHGDASAATIRCWQQPSARSSSCACRPARSSPTARATSRTMQLVEPSIYAPRPDYEPPEPAWKGFADFGVAFHFIRGSRPSRGEGGVCEVAWTWMRS